ncbi:ankyrin repeat domain-containing protein [Yinghuangia sp. KLBMP8922]|uniref:Ankyrin repeat domain-containing protein n=2 Tax=Yinghuangia soli TaxID=2908204 RepID=A0AA41U5K1_9ACTN|nr:ankyrin repeat domain-containing protein [Yinghuangia soli]
MLSLAEFLPDQAAEEAVVRALDELRRVSTMQGNLDRLQGPVAELVARPDPKAVYAHRDAVCGEHFVMLYAAETDCVPLFRLRIEGVGDRGKLEFYLVTAARMGAAGVVRYLGAQGADVNAAENDGRHRHTALHWAVYQNHPDTVAALIAQPGIDLDRLDGHGTTALDLALYRPQRIESAKLLTSAGAHIRPDTVVQVARDHDLAALDLVLRHGADPNAFSPKTGIAPLHAAAMAFGEDVVRRLLQAGADPLLPTRRKFKASRVEYPRGATPVDYLDLAASAANGRDPLSSRTTAAAKVGDLLTHAAADNAPKPADRSE